MRTVLLVLVITLTPSAIAGLAVGLPRLVRFARRRAAERRPQPSGPPLEQVAADLRRLLAEHGRVVRSPQLPARGRRLAALEAALSDRAVDGARALGLDVPPRPSGGTLPLPVLQSLLLELASSGLVLPAVDRFGRTSGRDTGAP